MAELEQLDHLPHRHDESLLLGAHSDFVRLLCAATWRTMDSFLADAVQHRGPSLAAPGEALTTFA